MWRCPAPISRGDILDDEFGDEDVSEVGMAHFERVLPQFDRCSLTGSLLATHPPSKPYSSARRVPNYQP